MPIETVADCLEQLADQVGVYGAHDDEACEAKLCRVCWTSQWEDRLREAFAIETQLERGRIQQEDSQVLGRVRGLLLCVSGSEGVPCAVSVILEARELLEILGQPKK